LTSLDWLIIALTAVMALWGYQQGLIVGALSLVGFLAGAILGGRLGPALLPDGADSPYAPATGLAGALLFGSIVAVVFEGGARGLRLRLVRRRGAAIADGAGGALLLAAMGLGLAWMFGAVALNAPGGRELRQEVQRSAILRALNGALPPSGFILNTLNSIDPGISISGPDARVGPPSARLARDQDVDRAGDSVVHVLGTACGLNVAGSGWVAKRGLVVTNAHVIAGEEDTEVETRDGATHDATPVHYDPANDLALLRVEGLDPPPLRLAGDPASGTSGAVLGYPEDGPFRIEPARLGLTSTVISQDSYGRGPVPRQLTALRGRVRSGNSGGPVIGGSGRVLTTVFAATTGGTAGGYGVPNEIVREALSDTRGEVSTQACTH
jgi:S1-C subfamily serine protease